MPATSRLSEPKHFVPRAPVPRQTWSPQRCLANHPGWYEYQSRANGWDGNPGRSPQRNAANHPGWYEYQSRANQWGGNPDWLTVWAVQPLPAIVPFPTSFPHRHSDLVGWPGWRDDDTANVCDDRHVRRSWLVPAAVVLFAGGLAEGFVSSLDTAIKPVAS